MKRPGLSLKWVVIWSLREGAGQGATGGFDRQVEKPIASLLLRQQTNQKPPISTKPPERLFVPDGPPASCVGALMAPNLGLLLTRKGSISLQYNTTSLAPKKKKSSRDEDNKYIVSLIHPTYAGSNREPAPHSVSWLKPSSSQLSVMENKGRDIINGIWADRTRHQRQQRAVNALICQMVR